MSKAAMVDVAAAELDRIKRRFIGRELADLY